MEREERDAEDGKGKEMRRVKEDHAKPGRPCSMREEIARRKGKQEEIRRKEGTVE